MPKINIPVTITLDVPAAAEWADIFAAADKTAAAKQHVQKVMAPTAMTRTVATARARKMAPLPAAVFDRLTQGGSKFVSTRNLITAVRRATGKRINKNAIHQHIYVLRTQHKIKIESRSVSDGGGYRLVKEAA
tara:strand:- start:2312 stop:2710 length:399 start_codon:yes stop_codon:yes gene_type:complete